MGVQASELEAVERSQKSRVEGASAERPTTPVVTDAATKKREAQQWLDGLPIRVVLRKSRGGEASRLVMYRVAANSREFWEKTWLVSPCFRMRGYTLPRWYKDVFGRRLPRDGVIVEAGCGNGNLVRMLLNEGIVGERGSVEGLDFAEDVIAENRKVHPTEAKTKCTYRVGDVRALPYADGSIAGYLSMGVVEHFDEKEREVILREAARCLRPGGIAVITVPHFSLARTMRAMAGGFEEEVARETRIARGREIGKPEADDGAAFYQFYFTAKEICGQIERAGLRVVELDGYDCRRGWIDAFGTGWEKAMRWIERRGPKWAGLVEQPPKFVRRFCPHMLMVVVEKA